MTDFHIKIRHFIVFYLQTIDSMFKFFIHIFLTLLTKYIIFIRNIKKSLQLFKLQGFKEFLNNCLFFFGSFYCSVIIFVNAFTFFQTFEQTDQVSGTAPCKPDCRNNTDAGCNCNAHEPLTVNPPLCGPFVDCIPDDSTYEQQNK